MITADYIARWCFVGWLSTLVIKFSIVVAGSEPPGLLSLLNALLFWGIFAPLLYDWSRSRTATEDKALFLMELAGLIRLSIPVDEAVAKLASLRARTYSHRFAKFTAAIRQLSGRVSAGSSLPVAFGEVQGVPRHWGAYTLYSDNPENLASLLEELAHAERSNLRLPFLSAWRIQIIVPVYLSVVLFLTTYIMPTFVELFKGMDLALPTMTRVMIGVSKGLSTFHFSTILMILCLLILLAIPFESLRRRLLRGLFYLPGANRMIKLDCQRQAFRLIGAGLKHGVPLTEALRAAALSISIPAYRNVLLKLESEGVPSLGQSLAQEPALFDQSFVWLIKQGEALENLPDALLTATEVANVELDRRSRKLATNLDTVVLVAVGVFVGMAAVSVFLPIYMLLGHLA